MHKVGSPFWKTLARMGVPVSLRVDVRHDGEAKVFIATSPDLKGLVVEAATVDELISETNGAVGMLIAAPYIEAEKHARIEYHLQIH